MCADRLMRMFLHTVCAAALSFLGQHTRVHIDQVLSGCHFMITALLILLMQLLLVLLLLVLGLFAALLLICNCLSSVLV